MARITAAIQLTSPVHLFCSPIKVLCVAMLVAHVVPSFGSDGSRSGQAAVESASSNAERARALMIIARSRARVDPGEARRKAAAAVDLAGTCKNDVLLLEALRLQRDIEFKAGSYDQYLATALRVVAISEKGNDPKALADDLRYLCAGYERVGDHDKAIETRRQALFLLKGTGDSVAISNGIIELINSLVLAGRFNEVVDQSAEAMAYYEAHDDSAGQAMVLLGHGEALLAQGRPADALPLLHRAERILRSVDQVEGLSRALRGSCEAHIGLKNWAVAFQRSEEASMLTPNSSEPKFLHLKGLIHEGLGDLPKALAYERAYAHLRDSLLSARVAERMVALQAYYNSQRADSENAALKAKVNSDREQIDQARTESRWWIAGFIIMVCSASALIIFTKRLRKLTRRAQMKHQLALRQAETIKQKNLELERQNLRLAESLVNEEHKDFQLKEIHHRVKNNLQIVNTLLKMQGSYMDNEELQEVLADCQGRVRSMAMVHEHIYRCGDLHQVNVKAHIAALGDAILKNYGLAGRVKLDLHVSFDHAELDTLIPLSLLLNELITNSAKHAFMGMDDGCVTVVIRRIAGEQCELVFSDNGAGMRQEQFFHTSSFGLELVRTLAAQLEGKIRLLKGEGTTFQMTFQPQERSLRKAS